MREGFTACFLWKLSGQRKYGIIRSVVLFLETSMSSHVLSLFRAAWRAPLLYIVASRLSCPFRHNNRAYGPSQSGSGA